jgi:hypothetical protein
VLDVEESYFLRKLEGAELSKDLIQIPVERREGDLARPARYHHCSSNPWTMLKVCQILCRLTLLCPFEPFRNGALPISSWYLELQLSWHVYHKSECGCRKLPLDSTNEGIKYPRAEFRACASCAV